MALNLLQSLIDRNQLIWIDFLPIHHQEIVFICAVSGGSRRPDHSSQLHGGSRVLCQKVPNFTRAALRTSDHIMK